MSAAPFPCLLPCLSMLGRETFLCPRAHVVPWTSLPNFKAVVAVLALKVFNDVRMWFVPSEGAFNTTRTNHTLVCLPDPFPAGPGLPLSS